MRPVSCLSRRHGLCGSDAATIEAVPTQRLYPAVFVVKAAKDELSGNLSATAKSAAVEIDDDRGMGHRAGLAQRFQQRHLALPAAGEFAAIAVGQGKRVGHDAS